MWIYRLIGQKKCMFKFSTYHSDTEMTNWMQMSRCNWICHQKLTRLDKLLVSSFQVPLEHEGNKRITSLRHDNEENNDNDKYNDISK